MQYLMVSLSLFSLYSVRDYSAIDCYSDWKSWLVRYQHVLTFVFMHTNLVVEGSSSQHHGDVV